MLSWVWAQSLAPIIWRDSLGVPHIYARTDREVAYGLGLTQAEDVGKPLQENLLAARGELGRVQGREGLIWDFLRVWTGTDTIAVRPLFSEVGWALLEAFAAGVNAYFIAHPEERLRPSLFPVTADDVARGSLLILQAMTGIGNILPFLGLEELSDIGPLMQGYGSNAWAVAPSQTWDGGTYLLVNSHQPLEGRVAWYEAELYSEEGWHFRGGFFPGSPVPHLGANPALGWAHTMAYPHSRDAFALEVRRRRYRVFETDTTYWERLMHRKVRFRLRGVPLAISRRVHHTRFGPALRRHGQWYAMTPWRPDSLHPIEAWYRLSKARTLSAFVSILRVGALPAFYTTYADEEGHIALFSTFYLPQRDSALSWTVPIRHPTPAYISRGAVPFEQLPHVVDPPCGYVYNANQTPLSVTCPEAKPKLSGALIGLQRFTYNRAERLAELWPVYLQRPLTLTDLMTIKHDRCYARHGTYRKAFEPLFQLSPERYPHLAAAIRAVKAWSGCAHPEDTLTALVMLTHHYLEQRMRWRLSVCLIFGFQPTEEEAVWALQKAAQVLRRRYGTLYPRWDWVLIHGRGGMEVGVGGAPEVLEARHLKWDPKRRSFIVNGGDGLTYFIRWQGGRQTIWTLQPYGASHHPRSPHYTDQVRPFANRQYFETHLTTSPPQP